MKKQSAYVRLGRRVPESIVEDEDAAKHKETACALGHGENEGIGMVSRRIARRGWMR